MRKTLKNQIFSFPVVYESAPEGGYVAYVPGLPGCHTQGETLEETEKNLKEAITLYLESLSTKTNKKTFPRRTRILQGTVEVRI